MATAAELAQMTNMAQLAYSAGKYRDALGVCDRIYEADAFRTDNLLMLGAIHFQLRNFSESIFYNQQCVRVEPSFAESYSNLGNALKELGDLDGAVQFYLKAIKLKPRFPDGYNNLGLTYMQQGKLAQALQTYQMALVLAPGLVDTHCNVGNLYKAQGNLEAARRSYLEAIRLRPDFAIAWSNLAGVFKEEGQVGTAVAYYREAIRLAPRFADAYSNLGNALKEQGQVEEALSAFKAAVAIRPDFAVAHSNLASCLHDRGDLAGAAKGLKHAVQLDPDLPDAHNNLGNVLRDLGGDANLDEAVLCFRTALRLKPDHPHAYNNLGNALRTKGQLKEAIHCLVTAARLMPKFAAAHSNLGALLKEQGRLPQAVAHFHEAIAIDPAFADAYSNLGCALRDQGRPGDATKCFVAAIQLQPNFAHAFANLGACYKERPDQLSVAAECFARALALDPSGQPGALVELAHTKQLLCDWKGRDRDRSLVEAQLKQELGAHSAQAGRLKLDDSSCPRTLPPLSVQPAIAAALPLSLATQQAVSRRFAERALATAVGLGGPLGLRHRGTGGGRLHVGYLSARFGEGSEGGGQAVHAVASVFGLHDRERVKVTCYATTPHDMSALRQRIEREAESVVDLSGLSDEDAARRINSESVHLLVDLTAFTRGGRPAILAHRPAPLQLAFAGGGAGGHGGTLGTAFASKKAGGGFVDYLVADRVVVPAEVASWLAFDEKLLYLPHSCIPCDHKQTARFVLEDDAHAPPAALPAGAGELGSFGDWPGDLPSDSGAGRQDMPTRADYGLPEDVFVFCYFGSLGKVDPRGLDAWASILKRVPNSVLWLLRLPSAPAAERNFLGECRARGLDPSLQVVFSDACPRAEHLARGKLAELFLDPPAHGAGGATACDALWGGTPVLTVLGETPAQRVAASCLGACNETASDPSLAAAAGGGLGGSGGALAGSGGGPEVDLSKELVCLDLAEYEERAVLLANDADHYMRVRGQLERGRESGLAPLFDTGRWVAALEAGMFEAWDRHERGLEPDHIHAPDPKPPL